MPNSSGTDRSRPSFLCEKVTLTVPDSWDTLTQDQLRRVLLLYVCYDGSPTWQEDVKVAALLYFTGINVERHTKDGWLCQRGKDTFLLDSLLLPSMVEELQWLDHPEEMTVRLELLGKHKAADMWLHGFPFGNYLALENFYQTFLKTLDAGLLKDMASLLYGVKDDEQLPEMMPVDLLNVQLWYGAVKHRFGQLFPNFLRPAATGGVQPDPREMMNAQIRLLTKGDITKCNEIRDCDTWDALTELDALARESEEFKRKYGKSNV